MMQQHHDRRRYTVVGTIIIALLWWHVRVGLYVCHDVGHYAFVLPRPEEERRRDTMPRNSVVALAVSVAAATLLLGACSSGGDEPTPAVPGSNTQPAALADPYTSNGTWAVPDQIAPGRYRVTPNTDPVVTMRWYQLCADPYCEKNLPETTRYASAGGDFLLIPNDGSVRGMKNNGVKLEAVQ